jgi:tRNA(fMet)-specific endonuclease VapC
MQQIMTNYLLDTNHASRLMANDARIADRLRRLRDSAAEFGVPMTVVGELYYAVYASQRREQNMRRLKDLLNVVQIYPFDQAAAEEFGRIQAEQKVKGRPIRPLDAQIAAVARQRRLTVLTADKHFTYIADLAVEDWLAE